MKSSRRIKRMERRAKTITKMNLTSLMDVFTILVFFLLVNSGSADVLEAPKQMVLPESKVQVRPRETVVIYIGKEEIVVQGKAVALTEEVAASSERFVPAVSAQLDTVQDTVLGTSTQAVSQSQEITVLADKTIPFNVIQRVMATCTQHGYEKVSMAVMQRDGATAAI